MAIGVGIWDPYLSCSSIYKNSYGFTTEFLVNPRASMTSVLALTRTDVNTPTWCWCVTYSFPDFLLPVPVVPPWGWGEAGVALTGHGYKSSQSDAPQLNSPAYSREVNRPHWLRILIIQRLSPVLTGPFFWARDENCILSHFSTVKYIFLRKGLASGKLLFSHTTFSSHIPLKELIPETGQTKWGRC